MINAAFNVGAISGAAQARRNSKSRVDLGFYNPEVWRENKPRVMGMIKIERVRDVSIEPAFDTEGVEICFRNVTEVCRLIDKLERLRDDMIEKGAI